VSALVDANIFVRLLTGDDPDKAARCLALFERARIGEVSLVTSEAIVAEVAYVLTSPRSYRIPRATVATALLPLLADPGLQVDNKAVVLTALDVWEDSNLDFADCLAVARFRHANLDGIYSYDRDFDRIPDIRRLEP
jgi:predicted nucleic acid-binding protein